MAETPGTVEVRTRHHIQGVVGVIQLRDGADNVWSAGVIFGEAVNERTGEQIELNAPEAMGFKVFSFTVVRDE